MTTAQILNELHHTGTLLAKSGICVLSYGLSHDGNDHCLTVTAYSKGAIGESSENLFTEIAFTQSGMDSVMVSLRNFLRNDLNFSLIEEAA